MIEVTPESNPEPHRHRLGGSLWVGIAFVLFGIIMILQTAHLVFLNNWWALFIMIPALSLFGRAWTRARDSGGRFTRRVAGAISGGLFISAVALFFLFNVDWGRYWPVFIVLAGLNLLLRGFARRDRAGKGVE
jgi:hypothetical protein